MKIITIITTAIVAVGLALPVRAATTQMFGSMPTVNGTTNSQNLGVGSVLLQGKSLQIQYGGLTSTNDFVINAQVNTGGTNFITVASWGPSSTNATTNAVTWSMPLTNLTIYGRVQFVSTNATPIGVQFTQ